MSVNNLKPTLDEEKQQELMAKYDREFTYRKLTGLLGKMVFVIAIVWSLWQLYTATFGLKPPTIQRGVHVGFGLVLVYLLYPLRTSDKSNKVKWYDFILLAASIVVVGYHVLNFEDLLFRPQLECML